MLFSTYIALILGLAGVGLIRFSLVPEGVSELTIYLMFFSLVAATARGGPGWLISQVVLWLIWSIILGATNPLYAQGYGEAVALFPGQPRWQSGLFYLYWSVTGLLRVGALVECEARLAHSPHERWAFRLLILFHLGMWMSVLAFTHLLGSSGLDGAEL